MEADFDDLNHSYIRYSDPDDVRGGVATEAAKILGVLVGIGTTPFLGERFGWFWVVGLVAGVLTMAAGGYAWWQQRRRYLAASVVTGSRWQRLWNGLRNVVRVRRWWHELREGLRGTKERPLYILPLLTAAIGVFILIPAIIALVSQRSDIANAGFIGMYFSTPAILLWIGGEGIYLYPHLITAPKYLAQISGILKSGFQIASALCLWVFLGVSISLDGAGWLYWTAVATAVIGGILGLVAIRARGSRGAAERSAPPLSSQAGVI